MMLKNKSPKSGRRSERVEEVLKIEIADILNRRVKDPRTKKLTITGIEITPDLRWANISVCRFMADDISDADIASIELGLRSVSHFIYESLKGRLRMKTIPSLRFRYDPHLAHASHVWGLINRVKGESHGRDDISETSDI